MYYYLYANLVDLNDLPQFDRAVVTGRKEKSYSPQHLASPGGWDHPNPIVVFGYHACVLDGWDATNLPDDSRLCTHRRWAGQLLIITGWYRRDRQWLALPATQVVDFWDLHSAQT